MNILCTFNSSKVRRRIFLENVVTVVDAVHALETRDTEASELFQRQIRGAYMIVLNRVRSAGPARTQKVREIISDLLPGASIFESDDGTAPLALILGDGRLGQSAFKPVPTMDDHEHPFSSMVYRTARPIRRMEFMRVMTELASKVYRAKGFVNFKNYPLATLYQKVGSFQSSSDGSVWGEDQRRTELVLIGAKQGFDQAAITNALDYCCAD
jgi:G3E family GTPase